MTRSAHDGPLDMIGSIGPARRQRLRITAGVLLIAFALVNWRACESFAAQPPTRAISSKTYVNERFKFSFDYPASWSVHERSSSDRSILLTLKLLSPDENVDVLREYSPGSFAIEVFSNSGQLAVRDWLDANGWPFGQSDGSRSVTATTIGGLPALEITTGKMYAPNRFIYVATRGAVVRIAPLAAQSQDILRSFRFKLER